MNPFDEVKLLLSEKDAEIKNPFMVNRILSFTPEAVLQARDINNHLSRLPKWAIRPLFNLVVPKSNRRWYFKYARKSKTRSKKLLEKIRTTYCVNEYHARQIMEILKRENIAPERLFGLKEGE